MGNSIKIANANYEHLKLSLMTIIIVTFAIDTASIGVRDIRSTSRSTVNKILRRQPASRLR